MLTKAALALVMLGSVLLSGCPGEKFASCSGPVASHPAGKCSARYYQADYRSGGQVTQALVTCDDLAGRSGGNIVAIHSIAHGIGLKWVDQNTLEVAVPAGERLQDRRSGDVYDGYALHYIYRDIKKEDPAYQGCGIGEP